MSLQDDYFDISSALNKTAKSEHASFERLWGVFCALEEENHKLLGEIATLKKAFKILKEE